MASKYLPIMPGAFSCVRAVDREQTVAFISPARHYHVVVVLRVCMEKNIIGKFSYDIYNNSTKSFQVLIKSFAEENSKISKILYCPPPCL